LGLVRCCLSVILSKNVCQTGNFIQVIYKVICRDLAVALALIYILQSVYVIVKLFLKIIGTFCNYTFLVGAGIARPNYADDTVQPRRIVPADMGRAMPAPTENVTVNKATTTADTDTTSSSA